MDVDPARLPLGFLLNTLGRLVLEETQEQLAGADVGVIELGILWLVDLAPGHLQSDYARFQHRDVTTFGRYVDKLEDKGLILRNAVPDDRRAKALSLTRKGQALLRQLRKRAEKAEKAVVGGESEAMLTRVKAFLVGRLEAHDSAGRESGSK